MVMDHYSTTFPQQQPTWTVTYEPSETERLRKLIDEFKEAVEAAKKLDVLTNQPDCVDPEKAKLEERVAELERQLAKAWKPRRRRK